MFSIYIPAALLITFAVIAQANPQSCPQIQCPYDNLIPNYCQKSTFFRADDGTRCQGCDKVKAKCDLIRIPPELEVDPCPQLSCPNDINISTKCSLRTFIIGLDNQTRCRVCDRDKCANNLPGKGNYMEVCPQIMCPMDPYIPQGCEQPSYIIGLDQITKCTMCDANRCESNYGPFRK